MSDYDALLAAVRYHPRDDTPRGVMADYLDDNGDPERAAFIRAGLRLAVVMVGRIAPNAWLRGSKEWRADWVQEAGDLADAVAGWSVVHGGKHVSEGWRWTVDPAVFVSQTDPTAFFHRGFVSEIRCGFSDIFARPCFICGGHGLSRWSHPTEIERVEDCENCDGSGWEWGNAIEVIRANPVERVWLTDPVLRPVPTGMPGSRGRRWFVAFGTDEFQHGRYSLSSQCANVGPHRSWEKAAVAMSDAVIQTLQACGVVPAPEAVA